MQRGSCVLALLIARLAIGCDAPASVHTVEARQSSFAPEAIGDDGVGTILIVPNEIELSGVAGLGTVAAVDFVGSGASTHLVNLAWVNDTQNAFDATDPTCNIGSCPYTPTGFLLPETGSLSCTPNMSAVRSATLQATSNTGAIATAFVTCRVAGSGPSFAVPASVGRIFAPVGGTTPAVLVVTNNGGEDLMITVALDTGANSAHWAALECTTNPCPLTAGNTLQIDLEFSPTEHGDLDSSLVVSGPGASATPTVDLLGTGVGGKLRVDQPEAPMFEHDFGTIARNQLVTFQVEMTNVGNDDLDVTPGATVAPFGAATTPVTIGDGGQGTFDVTCTSGTALAQQTATLALTSDAYDQNTPSITVKCAVANTTVLVTNPLDFQELRTGGDPGELDVVIENPVGGGSATIKRIDLVGAPNALVLTKPTLPATLADGEQLMAKLVLATGEDLVLVGVELEVEVTETDTVTLQLPVTGKVGTPNAVVAPTRLDLGSVCVGTPVAGQITMSNAGSATLNMQRPTMSSTTFVPVFIKPTDYPVDGAPLLVGDKAMVGVMPTGTLAGLQEGTLEWGVDAPNSPFKTDVSLRLVMEGTAVSPGGLMFGAAPITEAPRMEQTITLENCGPDTSTVRYGGVAAELGTANAWLVDPPTQIRELLPDETMRVRVAFSPNQPGPHRSRLAIDVDGSDSIIILEGDATGELPVETSFYACGCSGSADPERGWPILIAFVLVVRRRGRRTISAGGRRRSTMTAMRGAILAFFLGGCQVVFSVEPPPVQLRGKTTGSVMNTATISIPRPPEVLDGDALVFAFSTGPNSSEISPILTELWNHTMSGSCFNQQLKTLLYTDVARGGETTYEFTFATPVFAVDYALIAYANAALATAHKTMSFVNKIEEPEIGTPLTITTEAHEISAGSALMVMAHWDAEAGLDAPLTLPPDITDIASIDERIAFFDYSTETGDVPSFVLEFPAESCIDIAEIALEPPT